MMRRKLKWIALAITMMTILTGGLGFCDDDPVTGEYRHTYTFEQPMIEQLPDGTHIVKIKDAWQNDSSPGSPLMPVKTARLFIPDTEAITSVTVNSSPLTPVEGFYTIQHAQKPYPPSYTGTIALVGPDPNVYLKDEDYPKAVFVERGSHHLHGFRIVQVDFNPVVYNPVQGRLQYYSQIELIITTTTQATPPAGVMLIRNLTSDNNTVLQNIENHNDFIEYTKDIDIPRPLISYEYVVITPQSMVSAFEQLTAHRGSAAGGGFTTHIKTIEDIDANYSGVDLAEKMRNFIRECYQTYGTQYVVLGGDCDGAPENQMIPTRGVFVEAGGYTDAYIPSDLYFGCLDGDWNSDKDAFWGEPDDGIGGGDIDWYSEVYVGRIAADNAAEAQNQIEKIIAFETSAAPDSTLMVGEKLDTIPTWGADRLDWVYTYMNDMPHDTLYDRDWPTPPWSTQDIIDKINTNTFKWIHHLGHSNVTYNMRMYNSDIPDLNNSKYVLIYSQGCYSGSMDGRTSGGDYYSEDCFGEAITNAFPNQGAFAYIGNSRYGWYSQIGIDSYSNLAHKEFVEAIFTDGHNRLGTANQESKKKDFDYTNWTYRWIAFETNLLGDPATPATPSLFPDLAFQSFSVSGDTLAPGQAFTANATVVNQGTAASTTTTLRYYLSEDSTISPADTELNAAAMGALTPEETFPHSQAQVAPDTPGIYYIGACVDAVSGEADTSNNCSLGTLINVDPKAQIISPEPDTALTSTKATFTWTDPGAEQYQLLVSAIEPGESELFMGPQDAATSATVSGLPDDGGTIYVRLLTLVDGNWLYNDYTYTAYNLHCVGDMKILASDGAAGFNFGRSVSISGDYAIAGRHFDNGEGDRSGAAYIYKQLETNWSQQAKLTIDDAFLFDFFGWSVAISGNTAIVGNFGEDDAGVNFNGAAYVFQRYGETWRQQARLTGSETTGSAMFGLSVAISGDTAVVLAPGNDAAYVFQRYGEFWSQKAKLTANNGTEDANLGNTVAISGDTIVVGSDDYGASSAYLFVKPITGWQDMNQIAKLTISDAVDGDFLGYKRVSVSGDTIVVGVADKVDDAGTDSGAAYVFVKPVDEWQDMTETAKLVPNDAAAYDSFGTAVSISGDTVIISALNKAAYIYKKGVNWRSGSANQVAKLNAPDAAPTEGFGFSAAISGEIAIVGSPQDDDNGDDSGSAYLFCTGDLQPSPQGDLNNDSMVDLADAIIDLQVITGYNPPQLREDYGASGADVNGDNKVGMEELIYILEKEAELK